MKTSLVLIFLFGISFSALAEENWQKWVHQKSEKIRTKQIAEHQAQCVYLKALVQTAINDVSNKWTCCSDAKNAIDYAIMSIDSYYGGKCWQMEMLNANLNDESYHSLAPIRDDLVLLKQYTPECR